jgi:N,N'-diacetyllegionaminate synthase
MESVYIIAEAGVNHNGDYNIAQEMIVVAKESGADAVKFQTAVPELVMTKWATKAEYQKEVTDEKESQLEMSKKIHLPLDAYASLAKYSDKLGIDFLSTPFDHCSIKELKKLKLRFNKAPSGEITNLPYLREMSLLDGKLLVSTGMSTLDEVDAALAVILSCGKKKEDIIFMHCNTAYPTPFEDVNLKAMITMKQRLNVDVGYSDHSLGIEVPIAAVVLGAKVIEKHFTLDQNMDGPDHKASISPNGLKEMVIAIRNIEKAMGDGIKQPSNSELKNIDIARRSIVAKKEIRKGELFSEENLIAKRPGSGISPMQWDEYIGKKAQKHYNVDDLITE